MPSPSVGGRDNELQSGYGHTFSFSSASLTGLLDRGTVTTGAPSLESDIAKDLPRRSTHDAIGTEAGSYLVF